MVRTVVAMAVLCLAGVAHAADGRLAISGAVVTPTCGVDAGSVQQASQSPSQAIQASCIGTRSGPRSSSAYQLKVTSMNGVAVDQRVQTYFQQFSPDAGTMVAVQTYR